MNKYIILTTQRSGSTWLVDTLNGVENSKAYSELFLRTDKKLRVAGANDVEQFCQVSGMRPFKTFRYLDRVYGGNECIGIKLMYKQLLRNPEIFFYILSRRISVVHLVRKNSFNVVLSRMLKSVRGVAHVEQKLEDNSRVYVNVQKVSRSIRIIEAQKSFFRAILNFFRIEHLEVNYEALVDDHEVLNHILRFVGCNGCIKYRSKLVKIDDRSVSDKIQNYAEVEQFIKKWQSLERN